MPLTHVDTDRLLDRLESARRERADQKGVEGVLAALAKRRLTDADRLRRLHDALLYLAAFPSRLAVRRRAEMILHGFAARVETLDDRSALEGVEHSGIAGTEVTSTFSFDLLRALDRLAPRALHIEWSLHDAPDRLAEGLPRFLPLLEEESLADANVPYAAWLEAARRGGRALSWLLSRFDALPVSPKERAEIFNALALWVAWRLGRSPWSRTALRLPDGPPFFHGKTLLTRRDVDLRREIARPGLSVRRLSAAAGRRALEAARAALAVRYREFYGFNVGDPARAVEMDAGRGIHIRFFGLPPERRLPLRAGFAELVTRNGIPVGYGDGFALCERVDVSFNIFPEYRDGETAFVFASLLRAYRRLVGASVFSIDPYQIGFENEEAIESGAFWFYRRLGFRSVSTRLEALARREEERSAAEAGRRSTPRVLRALAGASMIFDAGASGGRAWDRFHVRNIGLAVERRMAASGLSAPEFRKRCADRVAKILPRGASLRKNPSGSAAFESLAMVLDLVPDLGRWSAADRAALAAIVAAKSGASEARYVRRTRRHARLRSALIKSGSPSDARPARRRNPWHRRERRPT